MVMNIISMLYDLSRTAGKAASIGNDVKNLSSGHPERVIKKQIRREMHKNLNSMLRKF